MPPRARSSDCERYSYWSAFRTFSREARRAGMIAATIPARPRRAPKVTSVPTGSENVDAELRERLGHERREPDPERDAERRADQRR